MQNHVEHRWSSGLEGINAGVALSRTDGVGAYARSDVNTSSWLARSAVLARPLSSAAQRKVLVIPNVFAHRPFLPQTDSL